MSGQKRYLFMAFYQGTSPFVCTSIHRVVIFEILWNSSRADC